MIKPLKQVALLAVAFLLGGASRACADVRLPSIFGDHMVLQEGIKIPIWGEAEPGEAIKVTLSGESASTTASADRKWRVDLPALPFGTTPLTMTVAGANTVTFNDVLIGDVWLCSGQSNMEFTFARAHDAVTERPKADDRELRFFVVKKTTSIDPLNDVSGSWQVCAAGDYPQFSAVGYFFGRYLRTTLDHPIGLIGSYFGGTPAEAWTSLSGLQKEPEFQHYIDVVAKIRANYGQAVAVYPAKLQAYESVVSAWERNEGKAFAEALKESKAETKKALASGKPVPAAPKPPGSMPKIPVPPNGGQKAPATLFNGMIAPLVPYGLKGVIWYQGENNVDRAAEYRILFPRLITDWREKWGEGDFPFLFVQLARFKGNPEVQNWPFLREAQLRTLALPNTGMASAVDIGNPNDIHPKDKLDVGNRLALVALHVAYGQKLVWCGPLFKSAKIEGKSMRVSFNQTGGGLIIGRAPWTPDGVPPISGDTLAGFTIAGKDQKFVSADAIIDGDSVIVSSPQTGDPVAVRYAWANAPAANLYNKEGLPASPFRTDQFPDTPSSAK